VLLVLVKDGFERFFLTPLGPCYEFGLRWRGSGRGLIVLIHSFFSPLQWSRYGVALHFSEGTRSAPTVAQLRVLKPMIPRGS